MIIINNEEALKVVCEDVKDNEIGSIIDQLEIELKNSARLGRPGIGLAAPQIGIAKKVAIIRLDNFKLNLINAKIEKSYDPVIFKNEGCLSFPGRIENTMRYQEIVVENDLQYPHKFIASGLVSVVCQHELDHLNGILLPDRAIKVHKIKHRPNDSCPCGVIDKNTNRIKKFKKCCGKNEK